MNVFCSALSLLHSNFVLQISASLFYHHFSSCASKSDMYGNATITCQHDGTWTKLPDCLKQCEFPTILNRNITQDSITIYRNNSFINVKCNVNAKLHGLDKIICNNGTWSDSPSCNIYRCYKPVLGSHTNIEKVTEYLINTSYNVTCDKGYEGSVTAYCKSDGVWDVTGSCGIQNCSSVPIIPNSKDNYGSIMNYSWNGTFTYR